MALLTALAPVPTASSATADFNPPCLYANITYNASTTDDHYDLFKTAQQSFPCDLRLMHTYIALCVLLVILLGTAIYNFDEIFLACSLATTSTCRFIKQIALMLTRVTMMPIKIASWAIATMHNDVNIRSQNYRNRSSNKRKWGYHRGKPRLGPRVQLEYVAKCVGKHTI